MVQVVTQGTVLLFVVSSCKIVSGTVAVVVYTVVAEFIEVGIARIFADDGG